MTYLNPYEYFVAMKSHIKLILLCVIMVTLYLVFYIVTVNNKKSIATLRAQVPETNASLKYILQWTQKIHEISFPFFYMGLGQQGFISRNCTFKNCFITTNASYFDDYRKFDIIVFSGTELTDYYYEDLIMPELRSPHQKYVFASVDSPDTYSLCNINYNNYFNWTCTFKFDSEIQWGYITVRDLNNNVVGPKENMTWLKPEEMTPMNVKFKNRLLKKEKLAIWFAPNYDTNIKLRYFVEKLHRELNWLGCPYDVCRVDIYGKNEISKCLQDKDEMCYKLIGEKYFFFLAFEQALSPDYVTEILLRALHNNVVPIVYGGADYSRFLPQDSYLDARKLGLAKLTERMLYLIREPEKYADYFRWQNHYVYQRSSEAPDTNVNCQICALLNDEESVNKSSVYENFTGWWNLPGNCISKQVLPENMGNRSLFIAQLSRQPIIGV